MMFRNLIPGHLCPDGQALPVSRLLSFGDCAQLRKEKSIASPVPGQGVEELLVSLGVLLESLVD